MRPEDSRISAAQIRRRNRRWTVYVMGFVLIVAASLWYKGFDSYRITPACDDLFSDKNDTGSFLAQKNGLVLDSRTGLTWYSCSAGQRFQDNECLGDPMIFTWEQAQNFPQEFSASSSVEWRLPSEEELKSIRESQCRNPSINRIVFPGILVANYWSSTPSRRGPGFGCAMYTYDGRVSCMMRKEQQHPILLILDDKR